MPSETKKETCDTPASSSYSIDFFTPPPDLRRSSTCSTRSWTSSESQLPTPTTPSTGQASSRAPFGRKSFVNGFLELQGCGGGGGTHDAQSIAPNLLSLGHHQRSSGSENTPQPTLYSSSPLHHHETDAFGDMIHQPRPLSTQHFILRQQDPFSSSPLSLRDSYSENQQRFLDHSMAVPFSSSPLSFSDQRRSRGERLSHHISSSHQTFVSPSGHVSDMFGESNAPDVKNFRLSISPAPSAPDRKGASNNGYYEFTSSFTPSSGPDNSPRDAAMAALQCVMPSGAVTYYADVNMSDDDVSRAGSPYPINDLSSSSSSSSSTIDQISDPPSSVRRRRAPRRKEAALPLVVSSNDKPHACSTVGCKERFKRQEHLRRHERTHTGEKPELCIVKDCGKRFSRRDNLRAHRRTHMKQGGRNRYVPGLEAL